MEQIYNPYLPLTEYVPDGEPHRFGDRVYIYGSHDVPHGTAYCQNHYTVWSAPVDNLKEWKSHGVSYRRDQDPSNAADTMQLWAPDVCQGPDGRYYLYYCFSFYPEIGVAVSDKPEGPFEFYGHVHYPDSILGGKVVSEDMVFDPAVLADDDGRIYLYYGFCPAGEKEMTPPSLTEEELAALPEDRRAMLEKFSQIKFGEYSMVVELEKDMLTVKERPRRLIPGGHHTEGTGFEGHGFFEASSIRKIRGKYYFVYSSHKSHELCYAISDYPDKDFIFGGTIVSNGNVGLEGRTAPTYTLSNNHGGIVEAEGRFYIFYHRCTDGNEFSRQGMAEPIEIAEDGTIAQVEVTSCGLNGGPLAGEGVYPAGICAHMTCPGTTDYIDFQAELPHTQIRVTEEQNTSYVTAITDGCVLGYKYFAMEGLDSVLLELRGSFTGTVIVSSDEAASQEVSEASLAVDSDNWSLYGVPTVIGDGTKALFLTFLGEGSLEMKTIGLMN